MMEHVYVDCGIFNTSELPNTSIHTIWYNILTNTERITQPRNNREELSELISEYNQDLTTFEYFACNALHTTTFNFINYHDTLVHQDLANVSRVMHHLDSVTVNYFVFERWNITELDKHINKIIPQPYIFEIHGIVLIIK